MGGVGAALVAVRAMLGPLLAGLAAVLLVRLVAPLAGPLRTWLHVARGLRRFPGPTPWPVLGNIPEVGFDYRLMLKKAEALRLLYAPVVRAWLGLLPCVGLLDARDVELVLGGFKHAEKGALYQFIEPWLGSGLITAKLAEWRPHRRLLYPAFHSRLLAHFVPAFSRLADVCVERLAPRARGPAPAFDVQPFLELLTLDTLLETAMGVRLDVQNHTQHEYVLALKELETGCMERGTKPWLYPDWAFRVSPLGRRWKRALAVVHGTRERVLRQRQRERERTAGRAPETSEACEGSEGGRRRQALLDLLLEASEMNPDELPPEAVAAEVDTFMMAGFSTTTHALSVALCLLAQNPEAQERAVAEIESVWGSAHPPEPTAEQLGRLPYLERVIKEALRLYPPVMVLPRVAGCDFRLASREDLVVPEGCMVMISPYFTQRDSNYYPNPERFDPDRWLPENSQGRHPYSYIAFSAGPRNCIGKRFAQLQMLCILAKLLWRFELLPDPGFELWPAWALTTVLVTGSRLRLAERRPDPGPGPAEDTKGP